MTDFVGIINIFLPQISPFLYHILGAKRIIVDYYVFKSPGLGNMGHAYSIPPRNVKGNAKRELLQG